MALLSSLEAHESEVAFAQRRKARAADRLSRARDEDGRAGDHLSQALRDLATFEAANPPDQIDMFVRSAA